MPFCKKCGEKVLADADFCPECGARITGAPSKEAPVRVRSATIDKKKGFRIAGGVLTIIASCICVITGLIGLVTPAYWGIGLLTLGVIGWIAFAFGLTAGVLTLRKRVFAFAIVGEAIVMVAGILALIPVLHYHLFSPYYYSYWSVGLLIFVLSLLGLIFTAIAKRDFT